jgi:hypothetical protein
VTGSGKVSPLVSDILDQSITVVLSARRRQSVDSGQVVGLNIWNANGLKKEVSSYPVNKNIRGLAILH